METAIHEVSGKELGSVRDGLGPAVTVGEMAGETTTPALTQQEAVLDLCREVGSALL